VNWAAWSKDRDGTVIPGAAFLSSIGGSTAADLYSAITGLANGTSTSSSALNGTTIAAGVASANGINYGAMIRAIRGDASNNIVATPSAVTMDNQEAELKIAQEVPFVTGSYANSGTGGNNGGVNPFQTVQREEVGTILKVTPQLNGSDTVILKLELESSSLSQSTQAVDLITNKRTISTNVMIEDGGIVVLGGLISDSATKGEQRVPFLGRIPIIGLAFKTRNSDSRKSNLMVFIRPKILRDGVQAAFETDAKYRYMQDQQKSFNKGELLPLLPKNTRPKLDPPPPLPPKGTGEVDPRVQQEKLRSGQGDATSTQGGQPAPESNPPPASSNPPPAPAASRGESPPAPAQPTSPPPAPGEGSPK
jgi:general secretion pathway protein D